MITVGGIVLDGLSLTDRSIDRPIKSYLLSGDNLHLFDPHPAACTRSISPSFYVASSLFHSCLPRCQIRATSPDKSILGPAFTKEKNEGGRSAE